MKLDPLWTNYVAEAVGISLAWGAASFCIIPFHSSWAYGFAAGMFVPSILNSLRKIWL